MQTPSEEKAPRSLSASAKASTSNERRFLLKLTPIQARNLLPNEGGKVRNSFCTLVLLDKDMHEIRGEKQRTPVIKGVSPCWSPLKAQVIRSTTNAQSLGLGAAAVAEEYTFGKTMDLREAKYLLVKCKDKALVETEDLGRLLLSLDDLDVSGDERVAWYAFQLRPGGKMKSVQGEIQIASRIVREPSVWQLWTCAKQMMEELAIQDHSYYLKLHPQCFTGKEAVDWMLRHGPQRPAKGGICCVSEEEALVLGSAMIRQKVFLNVSDPKRPFSNSARNFYRFTVHHLDLTQRQTYQREMERILLQKDNEEGEEKLKQRSKSDYGRSSLPPAPTVALLKHQTGSSLSNSSPLDLAPDAEEAKAAASPSRMKIEDFELLRVLGTGAFGKVLSVRGQDGKVYALKIVSKIGMDETMRRNAQMERDVLRDLHHPFIATLSFAFQNEDKLYMGMEFFNGGDLRHHMNLSLQHELALTPARIQFYAAELVAGIGHLHSLEIIYRDLKPKNVMLSSDGHVKIVDFGLSKLGMKSTDRASTLAGSPDYIAPEILMAATQSKSGQKQTRGYDKACDWWSLGILIFEMYVGRTPFKDANQAIMYRNIQKGELFIPSELEPATQDLLKGLIERDPSKRLGTNEVVPFSIMQHDYFAGIDWEELQNMRIIPPWIPDVVDDTDVKYIDSEFINQVPQDTPEWRMLDSVDRAREHFQDFSYMPENFQRDGQ